MSTKRAPQTEWADVEGTLRRLWMDVNFAGVNEKWEHADRFERWLIDLKQSEPERDLDPMDADANGNYEDNSRECSRCEDEVGTLSSDGLCDGCVEEQAQE